MTATRIDSARHAALWGWAGLTIVALVVTLFVAFGIATTLANWGIVPGGPLRFDLALFLALFGVLGMSAVLLAARVAFGRWLPVAALSLVIPIMGISIAVAEELALHEWAEASMGYYDSDFIGWTAGLSFIVMLTAVASFGASIAPRGAAWPPAVAAVTGAVSIGLILLSNLPALEDGIGPDSWPLVVASGLCGAYAAGAFAIGVWRLRRG